MIIGNGGHSNVLKDMKPPLQGDKKYVGFVGKNCEDLRTRLNQFIIQPSAEYPVVVHETAYVRYHDYQIGAGSQILARAIINTEAKIGKFCVINTGAIIEHDAVIGDGTHVAPGAVVLGDARIGECCWIGANATVIQGTRVPSNTFIKANTVWKNK
jgi:tetrahydrodipicolinate N-succinyltransferase